MSYYLLKPDFYSSSEGERFVKATLITRNERGVFIMAHLITKQDNAFFLKAPAWHRLGIVKDTAITKYDLTNEFGWPVFKEQLFTARGEATTTYATIRPIYNPDGTLKERIILGDKLSEDYQVLQNGELINMIDPLLEAGCFVQTGGTLNQRRRIWVLLDLPSDLQVGNE